MGDIVFNVLSHLIRYISPLLLYPYLLRTLDTANFAAFSFILASGMIVAALVEFGFGLLTIRDLSASTEKMKSTIVGIIFSGRITCAFFVVLGLFLFNTSVDVWTHQDLILIVVVALSYGFIPVWFYVGTGRSRRAALLDVVCAVAAFISTLIFVTEPDEYDVALLCISSPLAVYGLWGSYSAISTLGFNIPRWSALLRAFRGAFYCFLIVGLPNISARWTLIALNGYASVEQVAAFAVSERLVSAALGLTNPIFRVVMPRLSKSNELSVAVIKKKFLRLLVILSAVFGVGVVFSYIFKRYIIFVFYGDFDELIIYVFALQLLFLIPQVLFRAFMQVYFTAAQLEGWGGAIVVCVSAVSMCLVSVFTMLGYGVTGAVVSKGSFDFIVVIALSLLVFFGGIFSSKKV